MTPKNRIPTHPGKILLEDFLKPKGMTQVALTHKMGVIRNTIWLLTAGRCDITPRIAILLARVLGTTEMYWMNLQASVDLAKAHKRMKYRPARKVIRQPRTLPKLQKILISDSDF